MANDYKASILFHGDDHLSSKNYGGHVNYSEESIECFQKITDIAINENVTHIISPGDFTYGRFSLIDRILIEDELKKRNELTNGNVYQLRGNHDYSSSGMTEWEYYVNYRKLMKPATTLEFDNCDIHMIDFGDEENRIEFKSEKENIIIGHNYFNFIDSKMPNFGKPIILDNKEEWKDVSMIMSGHIHKNFKMAGNIISDNIAHEVGLYYPGCLSRPEFTDDLTDEGEVCIIRISDIVSYEFLAVPLRPLDEAFQIIDTIKELKKVDISDILNGLNDKKRNIGSIWQIIDNMSEYKKEYREKAKDLLMSV